jgi:hypothetical protein
VSNLLLVAIKVENPRVLILFPGQLGLRELKRLHESEILNK